MAASQTKTADEIGKYAYEGKLSLLRLKVEENNSYISQKDSVGDI